MFFKSNCFFILTRVGKVFNSSQSKVPSPSSSSFSYPSSSLSSPSSRMCRTSARTSSNRLIGPLGPLVATPRSEAIFRNVVIGMVKNASKASRHNSGMAAVTGTKTRRANGSGESGAWRTSRCCRRPRHARRPPRPRSYSENSGGHWRRGGARSCRAGFFDPPPDTILHQITTLELINRLVSSYFYSKVVY